MNAQFVLLLLSVTAVTGEVLYWRHNSDWNNPANWNQNRAPCSAETVVFNAPKTHIGKSLPDTFEVRITADVRLKKLVIPLGGTLTLKQGVKITFSTASTCKNQGLGLVTDKSVNIFVGVKPHPWNCANNWRKSDGTSPSKPPCQDDSVVFQAKSSWIQLNSHVKVGRLAWEGKSVDGLSNISNYEKYFFKSTPSADVTVEPACLKGSPKLCPCQSSDCSFYPTTATTALPTTARVPKTLSPTTAKSPTSSKTVATPSTGKAKPTRKTPQPTGKVITPTVKSTGKVQTSTVKPTAHPSVKPTRKIGTVPVAPTKSRTPAVRTVKPATKTAPVVTGRPVFTGETTRKPQPVNTKKPTEARQTDEPVPCNPEVALCPPVICPEGSNCGGNTGGSSSGSGSSIWVGVGAGVGGALVLVIVVVVVIVLRKKKKRRGNQCPNPNAEVTFSADLSKSTLPPSFPSHTAYDISKPQAMSSTGFRNPIYDATNVDVSSKKEKTGSPESPYSTLDEYAAN